VACRFRALKETLGFIGDCSDVTAVAVRTTAKSELFMVLGVIAAVFWDVTPCDLVEFCRFATETFFHWDGR